jgi:hypothetical protein
MAARQGLLTLLTGVVAGLALGYGWLAWPFANDELSGLTRSHALEYPTLADLLEKGVKPDGHPAGVAVFLWWWQRWWPGLPEAAIRLPFILCSILALGLVARLGRLWFNASVGWVSLTLLGSLPLFLTLGVLARPYAPGLLFTLVAAWHLTHLTAFPNVWRAGKQWATLHAWGWALSCAACGYTHYFALLQVLVLGCLGLGLVHPRHRRRYVVSSVGAALLYLPHVHITQAQLHTGGLSWLGPPGWDYPLTFAHRLFGASEVWAILLVGVAVGGVIQAFRTAPRSELLRFGTALLLFALPIVVGVAKSRAGKPVLHDWVVVFTVPWLVLCLAYLGTRLCEKHSRNYSGHLPAGGLVLALVGSHLWLWPHFRQLPFTDFRALAQTVHGLQTHYGRNQLASVGSLNNPRYLNLYLHRLNDSVRLRLSQVDEHIRLVDLADTLARLTTPHLLVVWANRSLEPVHEVIIRQYYPHTLARRQVTDGGTWVLSRTTSAAGPPPDAQTLVPLATGRLTPCTVGAEQPYGSQHQWPAQLLQPTDTLICVAQGTCQSPRGAGGVQLVCSITNAAGETVAWQSQELTAFQRDSNHTVFRWVAAWRLPRPLPKGGSINLLWWSAAGTTATLRTDSLYIRRWRPFYLWQ